VNGRMNSHYANDVSSAAIKAGLPTSSVAEFMAGLSEGKLSGIPGATESVIAAAMDASHWSYARAYRLGWWSVVPFVVLATVAVACMRGVKELMTEKVEATVERVDRSDEKFMA
jgi:hypothetical protein